MLLLSPHGGTSQINAENTRNPGRGEAARLAVEPIAGFQFL